MKMTRREMIHRTTRGAVALTLASNLETLRADPASRRFKIGACEWSLRKADPSCMAVARQIGLDGVQVTMGSVGNNRNRRQPEVQRAYLEAARQNGVEVASLALSETNSVPLFSEPRAAI
ncbi:MAG: sugar phosphate isomerase/epimerase, partial [Candidatus Omnitrophica bacterium]|nr:sugar phosphate isomerase/epimerase [Candidatus Omnitrophota bacterium]